jgi:hypothetical protein
MFVLRNEHRTDREIKICHRKIFGYIRSRFANTPPTPISQPPIPAPKALRIRRRATLAGALAAQGASHRFGRAFGRIGRLFARERDSPNARTGDQLVQRRQIALYMLIELFKLIVDLARKMRKRLVGLIGRPVIAQADRRWQLDQLFQ